MTLAFHANGLKAKIVGDLLASKRPLRVLDYGAGDGHGWKDALPADGPISLYAFEPNPQLQGALAANIGPRGTVVDEAAFAGPSLQADVILSFSVLQQVTDRDGYFSGARRHLAPNGRFIVLYDDGFWRASEMFGHLQGPLTGVRQFTMNALAPVFRRLGIWTHYRQRVTEADVAALAERHGFEIVGERYGNLSSFKRLAKSAQDEAFTRLWIEVEDRLNAMPWPGPHDGHGSALWSACLSRAVTLSPKP